MKGLLVGVLVGELECHCCDLVEITKMLVRMGGVELRMSGSGELLVYLVCGIIGLLGSTNS